MNPAAIDPLADLRAYHLPDPVSWWPPAPGWWLLAVVLLALLATLSWGLWRRWRRRAVSRRAHGELLRLRQEWERNADDSALVRGLSQLLRRMALACYPRQQVAGLSGEAWLAFLDAHGGGGRFSKGSGRRLVDAPYRRDAAVPASELLELTRQWLTANREVGR